MTDRKTKMIELGDAFIAFPGGTGTLEEIAEVMSKLDVYKRQLHGNLSGAPDDRAVGGQAEQHRGRSRIP